MLGQCIAMLSLIKMNQRYIITGAPGTGKTAIINALMQERGYSCAEENSREIIAEQIINWRRYSYLGKIKLLLKTILLACVKNNI